MHVIRLRLTELLADLSFRQNRRIEWREVAEATGIHRTTLSKMANTRGYNATVSNLDLLCRYFKCQVGDIAVYVPDEELETPGGMSFKGPTPATAKGSANTKRSAATKPRTLKAR
jgi:putative transcriptional regulator